jgi:hypothetical protein
MPNHTQAPSAGALRKRRQRAKLKAAGLKRIEVWIDPRIERTVRAALAKAFR